MPGPSAGVAGGRPGAVRVPGGGLSVGPPRRTLRSARPVKSGPRPPPARRADHPPRAASLGKGTSRAVSTGQGECGGAGTGGRPGPAGGEDRQGRVRGHGRWPAARPWRRCGRRAALWPAGRAGWPPARDRRHPPSTPRGLSSPPGPARGRTTRAPGTPTLARWRAPPCQRPLRPHRPVRACLPAGSAPRWEKDLSWAGLIPHAAAFSAHIQKSGFRGLFSCGPRKQVRRAGTCGQCRSPMYLPCSFRVPAIDFACT
jgi:hypothetical protein